MFQGLKGKTHEENGNGLVFAEVALFWAEMVILGVCNAMSQCIGLLQGSELVSNDTKTCFYQMEELSGLLQVFLLLKKM